MHIIFVIYNVKVLNMAILILFHWFKQRNEF